MSHTGIIKSDKHPPVLGLLLLDGLVQADLDVYGILPSPYPCTKGRPLLRSISVPGLCPTSDLEHHPFVYHRRPDDLRWVWR
jgi:hypothetical protein